ncbi:roundabout homolog 3-like [Palaemon carinicauda]|uniref:roundabout homolog 3-like n=1 Tax=Palaemon carinicauda TaxID=392227 RepID=UPI0035B662B4
MDRVVILSIAGFLTFSYAVADKTGGAAPVIREQPDNIIARRNDPATLNCAAAGATNITWFRDGEQVVTSSQDHRSHRVLLPSGSLFFLRVATGRRDSDAGTYWCVASNGFGAARSRNASLVVASISYDFQAQAEPLVKVRAGEGAVLPCRPPKGSPEPSIKWLKNGLEVANSSRVFVTTGGDLVFNRTVDEDSGNYVCAANNVAGSRESSPSELVIMNPPWIQQYPKNVTTASGVLIELECIALGSPPPRVTWYRATGRIPYGRSKIEENKLTIEHVVAVDSGTYTCEASNEAGSISANATVTVVDAPVLIEKPQVVKATGGSKTVLVCRVVGNPDPLIVWRLPTQNRTALLLPSQSNGRASVSKDGQILTIEQSTPLDSGVYYCWGISSGGGVSAHTKVMIVPGYPPPVIGVGPKNLTTAPGSIVSLPCEVVSEYATPKVSWFYRSAPGLAPQQILESTDNTRVSITINGALIIKDIQAEDAGIYVCSVKANTGKAEQDAILQINENSKEKVGRSLPAPPSKPQVTAINETSVHLKWLPNSQGTFDSMSWYTVEFWKYGWEKWQVASAVVKDESCIISNLKPGEVYTFFIRAVSNLGASFPSPWSDPFLTHPSGDFTTPSDLLYQAQRRLTRPTITLTGANITGPCSTLLTWQFLTNPEIIEGVLVYIVTDDGTINVATVLGSSSSSHHLHSLEPYTGYTFFVVPFWRSIEGTPSNSFALVTPEDIPMESPADVQFTVQENGSALITWSTLTVKESRGKVIGYQITLTHNGSQIAEAVSEPFLIISNLVLGRLYTVRVAAQTGAGLGPFSSPVLMDLGTDLNRQPHQRDSSRDISDGTSVLYAPGQQTWLIYLLVPVVLLLFAATLYYVRRLHQKSNLNTSQSPVVYQDPTTYPSHPSINMYSEHKLWQPSTFGNTTLSSIKLLPSDHQLNVYAEPRPRRVEEMTEPYATTSLLMQSSPVRCHGRGTHMRQFLSREGSPCVQVNWAAFLPPPPSYPPPRDLDLGDPKGQTKRVEDGPRLYAAPSEYDNISSSAKYRRPCDATSERSYYMYTQVPVSRYRSGSLTFQNNKVHNNSERLNRDRRPRRPTLPPYNNTQ